MSLLWPESARKPNVEPMWGNGSRGTVPPLRVNNLASVVRIVTAFRSPNVTAKTAAERGPLPATPSLQRKRRYRLNGRISMATFLPSISCLSSNPAIRLQIITIYRVYPATSCFEAIRTGILALDDCVVEEFLELYVAYKAVTIVRQHFNCTAQTLHCG